MGISFSDLKQVKATLPPRLLIYGPPGMAKTSLSASFPDAVFIQTEDGTPAGLTLNSFGQLATYSDVMDALEALYTGEHALKTIVFDSVDKLQPLVWQAVCEKNNWDSIETPGYGKGYVEADYLWAEIVAAANALRRDRGMTAIYISHSDIERFDDPAAASYSRHVPRLHKRANAMISDEVDAILFINREASVKAEDVGFNKKRNHAEGGATLFIYTEGRPAYVAKNRYGMPQKMKFDKGRGFEMLAPYFPGADPATLPAEEPEPEPAAEPEQKPATTTKRRAA